jgi:hypothetical protein
MECDIYEEVTAFWQTDFREFFQFGVVQESKHVSLGFVWRQKSMNVVYTHCRII